MNEGFEPHVVRFKSFPIQQDHHLLKAIRYVEANPLRAGLVERAEDWPYSSLSCGQRPAESQVVLDQQVAPRPADWARRVNASLDPKDLERLQRSVKRGRPYGGEQWVRLAAKRLHLESTLRAPGRPRKVVKEVTRAAK